MRKVKYLTVIDENFEVIFHFAFHGKFCSDVGGLMRNDFDIRIDEVEPFMTETKDGRVIYGGEVPGTPYEPITVEELFDSLR